MTEPTYEINVDDLKRLTIADLTGLLTLYKLYPPIKGKNKVICNIAQIELDKRINDIIIF